MMKDPQFPGVQRPSSNFDRVRDGRQVGPFVFEIDLSQRRGSGGDAVYLPVAGNTFYIDTRDDAGQAFVVFEDTTRDKDFVTVSAGSFFKIPFTRLKIWNDAQPGRKLRIIYGVDLEFTPNTPSELSAKKPVPTSWNNDYFTLVDTGSTSIFQPTDYVEVARDLYNKNFTVAGTIILVNTPDYTDAQAAIALATLQPVVAVVHEFASAEPEFVYPLQVTARREISGGVYHGAIDFYGEFSVKDLGHEVFGLCVSAIRNTIVGSLGTGFAYVQCIRSGG